MPPDAQVSGRARWQISTIFAALLTHALRKADPRNSAEQERTISAIEDAAAQLSAGLKQMRAESSLDNRRRRAKEIGPLLGRLDRLMRETAAGEVVLAAYCDRAIGGPINQMLALCEWKLA